MADTRWFPVDGARAYLSGGVTTIRNGTVEPIITRKQVYRLVAAGMRVARVGDAGARMLFCSAWIDEFLISRSSVESNAGRVVPIERAS